VNYWLVKTEPETFSWDDLVTKGREHWDGVRNYQARNNLKAMLEGDQVLVYHSGLQRAVVGVARVVRGFYPDPTTDDERWVAVDLEPLRSLERNVRLAELRANPALQELLLLRHTRLSVMPVPGSAFEEILKMAAS
jgi:predicted RNA-binding protein with PUA-like domain